MEAFAVITSARAFQKSTAPSCSRLRSLSQHLQCSKPLSPKSREAEQALVAANRELVARFEKKIDAVLARVWGEEAATEAEPLL